MTAQFYKQAISAIGLSLERGTASAPNDGYFYVLLGGETKGRFRYLKQAQVAYRALLQQSDYTPPAGQPKTSRTTETVERYMDELETYWIDSHRYRRRGGKTMYRS